MDGRGHEEGLEGYLSFREALSFYRCKAPPCEPKMLVTKDRRKAVFYFVHL
jgi:hypothetical protein